MKTSLYSVHNDEQFDIFQIMKHIRCKNIKIVCLLISHRLGIDLLVKNNKVTNWKNIYDKDIDSRQDCQERVA
jgi:hypothetical protein